MLLSSEKNLLFIHIYKNGGMSIRAALLPQILKPHQRIWSRVAKVAGIPYRLDPEPFPRHSTACDVIDVIGEERFARYFSFAIVRNPWDWQVSMYSYMRKSTSHFQHQIIKKMSGFDEYIRWRCDGRIRLQKDFICAPDGRTLVSHVGRFEQLGRELDFVCQQIGVSAALPHVNVSNTRPYQEFFTPETRELVQKAFVADIEGFEYEFNG